MMRALAAVLAAGMSLLAGSAMAMTITGDTEWSGEVRVSGVVTVEEGATLTIAPGTAVLFEKAEPDDEGLATSGMLVLGRIIAKGADGGRIRFASAEQNPSPGDWGEVKLFGSEGSEFTGCDFRTGGWGIHVHDSALRVHDCTFTDNLYGGLRGKGGEVAVTASRFTGMELGIRYWQGSPTITGCYISGNDTGVFFRKECEGARLHGNNIFGNSEYDLKLGDAQEADIDVSGNWWGTDDTDVIRTKIFDRDREPYIGRAVIEPVLPEMAVYRQGTTAAEQ